MDGRVKGDSMNGEITLYNLLKSESSITDLLTSFSGYPAVAVGIKEPTTWGINDSTISIYNAVGVDNRSESLVAELTVNCRANTESKVKQIASAVITSVNRVAIPAGGRYYCQTLGIIPPEDENDSFNLPVTVTVKAVRELD